MNYSTIAFSDASKKLQLKAGSRTSYARMEKQDITDGLTGNEAEFIAQRDGFYMATIAESGFPYLQYRGGPKGFLKVLDERRIGFIDFRGNMQYISVGNLKTNNNVALFLMDYPNRQRLKLFAEAEIVELNDNPVLYRQLQLDNYSFKPERMLVLTVKAYSWNCPQHITPRYTQEEIFQPQQEYIAKLEAEIKALKTQVL
jgi:hypothetical protein